MIIPDFSVFSLFLPFSATLLELQKQWNCRACSQMCSKSASLMICGCIQRNASCVLAKELLLALRLEEERAERRPVARRVDALVGLAVPV